MINARPVVSYGLLDRAAFDLADDGDPDTSCVTDVPWVNGQHIVRHAWPERLARKYRPPYVADTLGLTPMHHSGESDARVLAEAVLKAADALDMTFDELLRRAHQPLSSRAPREYAHIRRDGSEEGPLAGHTVCFTEALTVPRKEAADLANALGAAVSPSVTSKATHLVAGIENPGVIA